MMTKVYLGIAGLLIAGYFGWSMLGWEMGGNRIDRVPSATSHARSPSGYGGYGRGAGGFFGSGFGK